MQYGWHGPVHAAIRGRYDKNFIAQTISSSSLLFSLAHIISSALRSIAISPMSSLDVIIVFIIVLLVIVVVVVVQTIHTNANAR